MARVDLAQITYASAVMSVTSSRRRRWRQPKPKHWKRKLWSAVAAREEQAAVQRFIHTRDAGEAAGASRNRRLGPDAIAARAAALRQQVQLWTATASDDS